MSLMKAKGQQIPSDAVILSEEEALKYQMKIMHKWKNKGDTFFFRYGGAMLATTAGLAGMYINNHYRSRFKLYHIGRMSTYLPIVVLPSALSFLFHTQFVLADMTLQKACPVCIEMRASTIQAFTGCVLPTILAPLSALALAVQYHTYEVPYFTKEPMKVLKLCHKITRPIGNVLFAIFVGQALLASTITYYEGKNVFKVNEQLAKLEHQLEHGERTSPA